MKLATYARISSYSSYVAGSKMSKSHKFGVYCARYHRLIRDLSFMYFGEYHAWCNARSLDMRKAGVKSLAI